MADNFYQLFTEQFSTNLEMLLQQETSLLRGTVVEKGGYRGKMVSPMNQIAAVSMKAPAGVFAPLLRTDPTFVRRWLTPQSRENAFLIDSYEELETIVDPKSEYVTSVAAAVGRSWDDVIIGAALGAATIGTDAASLSTETFPGAPYLVADTFGSSASSGLTVAKIIEMRRIFRHYHVDLDRDPVTLVIGSQQESDLLNQVQVVSTEFNDRPVLVDGRVTRFLGFNIRVSERLTSSVVGANTVRNCIAYAKSGVHLGFWKDMENRVSIRDDLSGQPYQLYTSVMYGATRTQLGKVIQINCLDATGSDITP